MHARVTIGQGKPGSADDAIRIYRDSVVPACQAQVGFRGLYYLVDREAMKSITISLWATADDMKAAEASGFYQAQVAKFKDILAAVPVREEYEVAVEP